MEVYYNITNIYPLYSKLEKKNDSGEINIGSIHTSKTWATEHPGRNIGVVFSVFQAGSDEFSLFRFTEMEINYADCNPWTICLTDCYTSICVLVRLGDQSPSWLQLVITSSVLD